MLLQAAKTLTQALDISPSGVREMKRCRAMKVERKVLITTIALGSSIGLVISVIYLLVSYSDCNQDNEFNKNMVK